MTYNFYIIGKDGETEGMNVDASSDIVYNLLAGVENIGEVRYTSSNKSYNHYYYLKDHLVDIKMILNWSGTVDSYNDFYPFGEQMASRNGVGSADGRYKYTSKERDGETTLDYFGVRYYDSWRGQWLSVDPKDSSFRDISPYAYCMNNPIRFIDLFGDSARVLLDQKNQKITFLNYGDGSHKDKNGKLVKDKRESDTWDVSTAVVNGCTEVKGDANGKIADDLSPKNIQADVSYGPGDWTYISTGNHKDIHGGGKSLGDPGAYADYQPLTPTAGCQRMHNAEVRKLSKLIREYKNTHPGEKVPYFEKK